MLWAKVMIVPCDSEGLLKELGYSFESYREPASSPEFSNKRFDDVLMGAIEKLRGVRMYKHQEEAFEALSSGKNVILVSGTGSGKTEAWVIPVIANAMKALAVYPTLALASDQLRRIKEYFEELGLPGKVIAVDSRNAKKVTDASVVATNPAFLMQDLKRIAEGRGYLGSFLSDVNLLVFDELDFYGSHGASAVLSMVEIISNFIKYGDLGPQVVLLTATLGDPEAVAHTLSEITGRETVIIRGKPFRVENRGYLVLTKDIEKLWKWAKSNKSRIVRAVPDFASVIDDFKEFKENLYLLVEVLRSKGIWMPSASIDYSEVIARYVTCEKEGLTLVFVNSIRMAEKLLREVQEKLPPQFKDAVASHHHMVSKKKREEIERLAREGKIKVIITPRTLAQGIDLGNIVRVVHIGLPDTVREFKQREGRKGRRGDIAFTETIIFPYRQWDKKLLKYGSSMLLEWTKLPLEKLEISVDNDWSKLFVGLWKVIRGEILLEEEKELLESLGLLKEGRLTPEGRRVWNNLGFYEYGPPYGIPRVVIKKGRKEKLPEVGRRDFVERLQPGCFDYTSDAIVVEVGKDGILEMDLPEAMREKQWVFEALQQYHKAKQKWGEYNADPMKDYRFGKLSSKVRVLVKPPRKGFGKLLETPLQSLWVVESRKADVKKVGNKLIPVYSREEIAIDAETYGEYEDYTYGFSYPLDARWEEVEVLASLAYALSVLRVKEAFDVTELRYSFKNGVAKEVVVWETEASGLLRRINWKELAKLVKKHKHDKMTELVALMIDPVSVEEVLKKRGSWLKLKDLAVELLEEIGSKEPNLKVLLDAKEVEEIPKAFLFDPEVEELWIYDKGDIKRIKVNKPRDLLPLVDLLKSGTTVTFMSEKALEALIRRYPLLYRFYIEAVTRNRMINLYRSLRRDLKLKSLSFQSLAKALGIELKAPKDYLETLIIAYKKWRGLQEELKADGR
ncbi:helicase [Ignicoccus pacificus DSM 13166]|uniref:Helicase n=1 Tax=Ignicoccus pacificus DSM 13166 TaxID=940294 RepID=A0A977KAR2_9CREN|nr:helicase [Ignicoccus pacificus DSM 13166]